MFEFCAVTEILGAISNLNIWKSKANRHIGFGQLEEGGESVCRLAAIQYSVRELPVACTGPCHTNNRIRYRDLAIPHSSPIWSPTLHSL